MSKQAWKNAVRRTLPSAITIVVVALMLAGFRVWAMPGADPASTSAMPGVVSYQGYLTDTLGEPVDAPAKTLFFSLWDAPEEGERLWVEEHWGVPVRNGLFNVMLGSQVPIPASVWSHSDLYLQVQVYGDNPMTPREPVGMVPYALLAQRATGLAAPDGDPADALTVTNDGWLTSGSGTISLGSNLFIPVGGMCIDNDGGCAIPGPGGLRVGEIYGLRYGGDPIVHLGPEAGSKVGIRTGDPQAELDVNGDIDWSGDLVGFSLDTCSAANGATTVCGELSDRACFLTRVHMGDYTEGDSAWRRCRVWWDLDADPQVWKISAERSGDAGVDCLAVCLIW